MIGLEPVRNTLDTVTLKMAKSSVSFQREAEAVNAWRNVSLFRVAKRKVAGIDHSDLVNIVVAHTGHSSQLFLVATGRNAQFLATVTRSGLVR
jgi:hypothetical protein